MRAFLPHPANYIVRGFWPRVWATIIGPLRPTVRFADYVAVVEEADQHNHARHVEDIDEIDNIHNYLGENIFPDMPAERLVQFARQVQAKYSKGVGQYPWRNYD